MAKKKMKIPVMKATSVCKSVSWGHMVVAALLLAIGFYLVLSGIKMQWSSGVYWQVFLWYLVGLFIVIVGKWYVHKGYTCC